MFKIAIIGKEKTGKKLLFQALTGKSINITSHKPNNLIYGIGFDYDERVTNLEKHLKPEKTTFASYEIIYVPSISDNFSDKNVNASIFNKIQDVENIIYVIDLFSRPLDNLSDYLKKAVDFILTEFTLMDVTSIETRLLSLDKEITKAKNSVIRETLLSEKESLQKIKNTLEKKQCQATNNKLSLADAKNIKSINLFSLKNIVFLLNISDEYMKETKYYCSQNGLIDDVISKSGITPIVPFATAFELEMNEISDEEKKEFLSSFEVEKTNIKNIVNIIAKELGYISFFTTTNDKLQSWNLVKGSNIVEAAQKIHTDIARGFIKAEVINYADLEQNNFDLTKAKKAGMVRLEGRDYIVQDGDIIHFRFSDR